MSGILYGYGYSNQAASCGTCHGNCIYITYHQISLQTQHHITRFFFMAQLLSLPYRLIQCHHLEVNTTL